MNTIHLAKYLIIIGVALSAQNTAQAQLTFDPPSIDLGDVKNIIAFVTPQQHILIDILLNDESIER